jgi:hypothetical protein
MKDCIVSMVKEFYILTTITEVIMSLSVRGNPIWVALKILAKSMVEPGDPVKSVSGLIESMKVACSIFEPSLVDVLLCNNKDCSECNEYRSPKVEPKIEVAIARMKKLSHDIEKRCEKYKPEIAIDLAGYRKFLTLCEETDHLADDLHEAKLTEVEAIGKFIELEKKKDEIIRDTDKQVLEMLSKKVRFDLTPQTLTSRDIN